MISEFFDFFPYMNLKIVTAIFRDALFLLFDMREAYAGSPPPHPSLRSYNYHSVIFRFMRFPIEISHFLLLFYVPQKYIRYA